MAGSRKRSTHSTGSSDESIAKRALTEEERLKVAKALLVSVVVSSVIAMGMTDPPRQVRQPALIEAALDWESYADRLEKRGRFRRAFRMDRVALEKLADLLEPSLQRNNNFASEFDRLHHTAAT